MTWKFLIVQSWANYQLTSRVKWGKICFNPCVWFFALKHKPCSVSGKRESASELSTWLTARRKTQFKRKSATLTRFVIFLQCEVKAFKAREADNEGPGGSFWWKQETSDLRQRDRDVENEGIWCGVGGEIPSTVLLFPRARGEERNPKTSPNVQEFRWDTAGINDRFHEYKVLKRSCSSNKLKKGNDRNNNAFILSCAMMLCCVVFFSVCYTFSNLYVISFFVIYFLSYKTHLKINCIHLNCIGFNRHYNGVCGSYWNCHGFCWWDVVWQMNIIKLNWNKILCWF